MKKSFTLSISTGTGAKLAAVAFICCMTAAITHVSVANTSNRLLSKAEKDGSTVNETLNTSMGVLSARDAELYRVIFAAQKQGDLSIANAAINKVSDKLLIGTVLADRYRRKPGSLAEMTTWLKLYGDQPEAGSVFEAANRLAAKVGKNSPKLPKPTSPDAWNGGFAADSAADFSVNLTAGQAPAGLNDSQTPASGPIRKLALSISKALHDGMPNAARDLLIAAQAKQALAGTFASDAEAAIGASYFYSGERDQARALTGAAATANQPLGLWIRGLIAFEDNDMAVAGRNFSKLAEHPAMNAGNRAAASFWAWRSLSKAGQTRAARAQLGKAAKQPSSFYGLLAAQMLGQNPVNAAAKIDKLPVWGPAARGVLAAYPAGLRAMALLQVGETARSEAELRRINPLGNDRLQQAMMALAGYVPMPALAVQLASLEGGQDYAAALYPVLPWKPQTGYDVDRALLFALARHESQFDPSAVSSRGACGLMQIMPSTAGVLIGSAHNTRSLLTDDKLFDPAFNMDVGQKYVRHLAERPQIGNNLVLLLAAYNSGPNKVAKWKQAGNMRDALLFMESIPVRETRNYITRVLPHYWAYRARLSEPLTSLRQMAEGQWPRLVLQDNSRHADLGGEMLKVASN